MRPNYKRLAEKYRDRCYDAENRISHLLSAAVKAETAIDKKNKEIEEWQAKYSEAMDKLIDLQERVAQWEADQWIKSQTV